MLEGVKGGVILVPFKMCFFGVMFSLSGLSISAGSTSLCESIVRGEM